MTEIFHRIGVESIIERKEVVDVVGLEFESPQIRLSSRRDRFDDGDDIDALRRVNWIYVFGLIDELDAFDAREVSEFRR